MKTRCSLGSGFLITSMESVGLDSFSRSLKPGNLPPTSPFQISAGLKCLTAPSKHNRSVQHQYHAIKSKKLRCFKKPSKTGQLEGAKGLFFPKCVGFARGVEVHRVPGAGSSAGDKEGAAADSDGDRRSVNHLQRSTAVFHSLVTLYSTGGRNKASTHPCIEHRCAWLKERQLHCASYQTIESISHKAPWHMKNGVSSQSHLC